MQSEFHVQQAGNQKFSFLTHGNSMSPLRLASSQMIANRSTAQETQLLQSLFKLCNFDMKYQYLKTPLQTAEDKSFKNTVAE